eukprot:842922-Pelagomonas_calceolata.AAC.9
MQSCPPDLDILAALASGQLDEEEEEEEEEQLLAEEGLQGEAQETHNTKDGLVLGNVVSHGKAPGGCREDPVCVLA